MSKNNAKCFNKIRASYFCTSIGNDNNELVPVAVYENSDLQKVDIIKENRGKSGVYRWVNKTNGKTYVGSSVDLSKRLLQYYSEKYLTRNSESMIICNAILKYGHCDLQLEILEYCDPQNAVQREQYFIDSLKPEYNILQTAGSLLGFIHSSDTKIRMSEARFGKKHSEETRRRMSEAQLRNPHFLGKKHSEEAKIRMRETQAAQGGYKIEVLDLETGTKITYPSISEAARALGIHQSTITNYFTRENKKPCKGRYIFSKI